MSTVVVRPPGHPKINAFDVAFKYANDVANGTIVAGKLVRLAAKRFLRDLRNGPARGLTFRKDKAQHVVDFFGFLKHSKGEWGANGGQVFVLSPWQVFILANIFGWYKADGTRRFREAYVEVARKNGKSTFVAGIGLYMLVADNEPGAEVYTAATKKDQAKIVFDEAEAMRKRSPFVSKHTQNPRGNMHVLETRSKFEPLSAEDDTLDGLNSHCVLIDELHAHTTRKLYDVLRESTVARRQALVFSITTAGYNRQGICFKVRDIGEKILTGLTDAATGDYFFAFIACMDEKDANDQPMDWSNPNNWPMANPNLGVSVKLDSLHQACNAAKMDPTALNSFLRKNLCVWTSQDVRWMPPDKWAACNLAGSLVPPVETRAKALARLKGRLCYAGLDLSSKIDLSALVLLFPPIKPVTQRVARKQTQQEVWGRKPLEYDDVVMQEGDPLWTVLPYFFVPEGNVQERVTKDKVEYDVWIKQGFIETTPGNAIDQNVIRRRVAALNELFRIQELGFDSWNASQLSQDLAADGMNMVEVRQGFKTMSEPMKEIMAMVLKKILDHLGNPVLSWCVANTQAQLDPAGNIKPDKEKSPEKIDGLVALIMALHRVTQNPSALTTANDVYSQRGIVFL